MRTTLRKRRKRRFDFSHAVDILALLIGLMIISWFAIAPHAQEIAELTSAPLPGPSKHAVPQVETPEPTVSTTAKPSNQVSKTPDVPAIRVGQVEQVYLPSEHTPMIIDAPVAQMPTDCKKIIDPPRDSARMRGVFQCGDFADAGTNSDGTVVLTGHSSRNHSLDTVFDHLSCTDSGCSPVTVEQECTVQQSTLTGRYIYLRTSESGEHWLIYKINHVYCPAKDATQDLEIKKLLWESTPGRLLLVTCLEQAGARQTSNNLIAVGEYVGVK